MPIDVLTGFVDRNGDARCRPVGVAMDKSGALLVVDDVGNTAWRVTPAGPKTAGIERGLAIHIHRTNDASTSYDFDLFT